MSVHRHIFAFAVLLLFSCQAILAQSQQTVQVVEYQGAQPKTPLSGVGVAVQGAAASVSDAQGQLTLQFRTLHAGDKVTLRRIELPGYEVFNVEAVEQWTVSSTVPFQLVLCRSDRFKALCDQYSRVASASYEKQFQKEQAALEALRREGKLLDQEYQQKLQEASDAYDQQLENLDLYVEKFARFDLSALSEQEQQIIALVQQGKLDDAIAQYEQLDLLGAYQQQSADLQHIRAANDSLTVIRQHKEAVRDTLQQIIQLFNQ